MTMPRAAWRRVAFGGTAVLMLAGGPRFAAAQAVPANAGTAAETAVRTGKYSAAIALYTSIVASDSAPVAAHRGLVWTLGLVGRYDDAVSAARRAMTTPQRTRELSNVLGTVQFWRGQLDSAEVAFTLAVTEHASDSLRALLNLAQLHFARGDRDRAFGEFDHFIDVYNAGWTKLTSDELAAVAMACQYLGIRDPQLSKDALKAYDRAIAKDSTNIEARIDEAFLFLDRYEGDQAKETFDAILAINPSHPRALLGAARLQVFDEEPGSDTLVAHALAVSPNYIPAHIFQAELLLQVEDYGGALTEIQRALAVDAGAPEALAVVAAIRFVRGDSAGFEDATRKALARNPRYADLFSTVAELSARNRFYAQAVTLARRGVALDSTSARALAVMGMNLMRTGDIPAAQNALSRAFKLDPYDVWVKNTLDLLDTFRHYKETTVGRFLLVADSTEAALFSVYAAPLAEEAFDVFAKRYNYRPPTPVRVEFFRSHADFSVRTVGLAGLGALGVSFGPVLALDSPSARDKGAFNWGSTLWHELAHTFTLGVSDHRVPRWFSEGLSVFEERRGRPGWGADVTPGFLMALKAGKLVSVTHMNDGFMRPAYPEQVLYSYYQASLVCDMIEKDYGPQAIPAMLLAYKAGRTTEEVFQQALHVSLADFDKKFDAAIRLRFAGPLAALRLPPAGGRGGPPTPEEMEERAKDLTDYVAQLAMGARAVSDQKYDEAETYLKRAKALFPEYTGGDSPTWFLAVMYSDQQKIPQAIAELTELLSRNESDLDAYLMLAQMYEGANNQVAAAATLERSLYIWPFAPAVHTRLAELYAVVGDKQKVVRERRAIVALAPVDMAEALYQLALAYYQAGDMAGARKEVLNALEQAPNFEKAQTLLLTIRRGSGGEGANQ